MSPQTQRIRDAEARYMELTQIVRELREKNKSLEESLKRLRAKNRRKPSRIEHKIKRAINETAKSLTNE